MALACGSWACLRPDARDAYIAAKTAAPYAPPLALGNWTGGAGGIPSLAGHKSGGATEYDLDAAGATVAGFTNECSGVKYTAIRGVAENLLASNALTAAESLAVQPRHTFGVPGGTKPGEAPTHPPPPAPP